MGPGDDGIQCNMTNTMNTPVEALEITYPLRVERYELRENSAGEGQHRGGNGLIRAIRILGHEARVSLQCERRRFAPYGLHGGADGKPGRNAALHADGSIEELARQGQSDARRRRGRHRRNPGRRRLGQGTGGKAMSEAAIRRMSLDEFLVWDDGTDTRYELIGGFPVAMAPGLEGHWTLSARLTTRIDTALSGRRPCRTGTEAGILDPDRNDTYFVADIGVTCAPYDRQRQYMQDPILLVEILSPSTERHDRKVKVPTYQRIASVQEILLVDSDSAVCRIPSAAGRSMDHSDHYRSRGDDLPGIPRHRNPDGRVV